MSEKKLRKGYTTGTCAAAASKAAAIMLLGGGRIENINVTLPTGKEISLKIENTEIMPDGVSCAVKKDSGDDPDITKGIYIYSKVSKNLRGSGSIATRKSFAFSSKQCCSPMQLKDSPLIKITGGIGIGIVTREGLDQPVGEYAINSVPRQSIYENVKEVCSLYEFTDELNIEISAPEGVEIAKRTFNPRLGIKGGISILGTSGIVEPMSEKALVDTIATEINVISKKYKYIVAVPGNYGADFAVRELGIERDRIVTMSNFVGDTIELAKTKNIKGMLMVGHIGKMVKLGGGIFNTHSRVADCRMEILASCGVEMEINNDILRNILKCVTTDEAVDLLIKNGIIKDISKRLIERIDYYTGLKADGMEIGTVVFSNKYGVLCRSGINIDRYR